MVTGEFDGVFKLFTTAELVIAAGALFNRLMIAALLFDLCVGVVPVEIQIYFIKIVNSCPFQCLFSDGFQFHFYATHLLDFVVNVSVIGLYQTLMCLYHLDYQTW